MLIFTYLIMPIPQEEYLTPLLGKSQTPMLMLLLHKGSQKALVERWNDGGIEIMLLAEDDAIKHGDDC